MDILAGNLSQNLNLVEHDSPKKRKVEQSSITYERFFQRKKGNTHKSIGSAIMLKWWYSITTQVLVWQKWKRQWLTLLALSCAKLRRMTTSQVLWQKSRWKLCILLKLKELKNRTDWLYNLQLNKSIEVMEVGSISNNFSYKVRKKAVMTEDICTQV